MAYPVKEFNLILHLIFIGDRNQLSSNVKASSACDEIRYISISISRSHFT